MQVDLLQEAGSVGSQEGAPSRGASWTSGSLSSPRANIGRVGMRHLARRVLACRLNARILPEGERWGWTAPCALQNWSTCCVATQVPTRRSPACPPCRAAAAVGGSMDDGSAESHTGRSGFSSHEPSSAASAGTRSRPQHLAATQLQEVYDELAVTKWVEDSTHGGQHCSGPDAVRPPGSQASEQSSGEQSATLDGDWPVALHGAPDTLASPLDTGALHEHVSGGRQGQLPGGGCELPDVQRSPPSPRAPCDWQLQASAQRPGHGRSGLLRQLAAPSSSGSGGSSPLRTPRSQHQPPPLGPGWDSPRASPRPELQVVVAAAEPWSSSGLLPAAPVLQGSSGNKRPQRPSAEHLELLPLG
jgi:hypothetical protein